MAEAFQIRDDCATMMRACGLTDMEAVFACRSGRRLDKPGLESWRQRWRLRLEAPGVPPRTVYLKRFDRPPLRRQIERWRHGHLLRSTAAVEWGNARALEAAGIPAVRALACGQQMLGPWEQRSCLLLEEVPGESLERWLPAAFAGLPPPARSGLARRLADGLARLVAGFHAAGFVHRDLYLCHVFVENGPSLPADPTAAPAFRLIDLQRVFRPRLRLWRWRIKDLAALDYSTPTELIGHVQRLRFLCRYVRCLGADGTQARRLVKPIAARTRRLTRRHGPVPAAPTEAAMQPGGTAAIHAEGSGP